MKLVEKKLFPIKVYPVCKKCEIAMNRENLRNGRYRYKCPNCNKEEKSDIYYPYIKYIGD